MSLILLFILCKMLLLLQIATETSGDTQALRLGALQYLKVHESHGKHARVGQPAGVQNAELQDFVLSGI